MTRVAILPLASEHGTTYCAIANNKFSEGATAGQALDALNTQLTEDESTMLIVIQSQNPDRFFDETRQARLIELMAHWRSARANSQTLPEHENDELERLVAAELKASTDRATALADELSR
jgi:hypothetical protein